MEASSRTWGPAARVLAASTISFYGDWLSTVAVVVVLYRLTGSAVAPAGYVLARVGPRLLGPLPGGLLADRFSPAHVVAVCSVLQGLLTASLIWSSELRLFWAIYLAVALAQLVGSMARPCNGVLMPRLAPAGQLGRINALYGTGLDSSIFVAPALGTPLLALGGPNLLFAIDAASFLVCALLMLTLPVHAPSRADAGPTYGAAAAGLRLVLRDPFLRTLAIAGLAGGMAISATQAVLVVAAAERFGGSGNVGTLYAVVGVGGLLGGFYTLRFQPPRMTRWLLVAFSLVETVSLLPLAVVTHLAAALVLLLLCGAGGTVYPNWGNPELQRRTPSRALGRVTAVTTFAQFTGMLLGASAALLLIPAVGWSAALFSVALVSALLTVLTAIPGTEVSPGNEPVEAT